jgi:uncharacterized protein (TIGR03083 family)
MSIDFLAHLRGDAARFRAVLRDADPAAGVPPCPDWDVDDLLWHLAEVFLFWGTIVRERLEDPDPAEDGKPERPADHAGLLALYDRAASELIATLETTPDDVACWTWSDDHTAGFVRRRMAHEALIHRLDAEVATGVTSEIDATLATDGVHEALQHFYGGYPEWSTHHADGPTGRVRTADTGAEWLIRLGGFSGLSPNSGKTYVNEPSLEIVDDGTPTFTVSAAAADLDAWMWNRPARTDVTIDGADADFQAFHAIITAGVD